MSSVLCQRFTVRTRLPTKAVGKKSLASSNVCGRTMIRRNFASTPGTKKVYVGVDEAGLGPILGPLAIIRTAVAAENTDGFTQLFKEVEQGVADSKKIHQNAFDISPIEQVALGGIQWLTKKVPDNASELFGLFGEKPTDRTLPWQQGAEELKLPIASPDVKPWVIPGVEPIGLDGVLVHPVTLNSARRSGVNRANLELQYISKILATLPQNYNEYEIVVDRLGGRVYYGEVLQQFWPDSTITVVDEAKMKSEYTSVVGTPDNKVTYRKRTIRFLVSGEENSALVAMASCMAKYVREVHMTLFNKYWMSRYAKLKPTSGYWTDAMIWMRTVNKLDHTVLPPIMDVMVRSGNRQ